jgi:hypothetical protein
MLLDTPGKIPESGLLKSTELTLFAPIWSTIRAAF